MTTSDDGNDREARKAAQPLGSDALQLRFTLPPGSYATVLVDALLSDASREA